VTSSPSQPQRLTATHWLILIIASIGFAFDIYELLMLPLVLPPALQELLPGVPPGSDEFNTWRALLFWVPAMAGGLFGLLGGYLTDALGRRRVLTWSILIYAASAYLAGFSTSMPMLLVLRTTTFIGVCIEFVAAVAWLAELFPDHHQRERVLGYTQAFSSIGGLLVGAIWLLLVKWGTDLPEIMMPDFLHATLGTIPETSAHAPWRYMLMSGLVPALPLILIRPFLPESPVWQQKKEAGTLKRPSFGELFSPQYKRTTIITTLMVACSYGAAFGAIQQIPQIVPALPEVKAEVAVAKEAKWVELAALPEKARGIEFNKIKKKIEGVTAGQLSLSQEVGGLVGRFILALLVVRIASKGRLIRVFQVPGLPIFPAVFAIFTVQNTILFQVGDWNVSTLHIGIFLAGTFTVAQFSFWGNYLPVVYPVHLRGTGESMAHNVGGRMLGTSFAAITSMASGYMPGADDATRVAYTAAAVGLVVYCLGFLLSFWLPQPREETIRE
jgi:MFS family permease